ncbi:hypothetical protein COY90_01090 [Candidatus Roizmanbacteria bacterium CG_4_10_14_0_8_um_filter_39_9]|uniref:SET domain-containing protein n=1 Tax=Candidatus Roizmanbacteria bacterium CG_4_10_14_0_8_um_filter_39_9 TaxID=1974829 RepID=A0A2M7QDP7_9BACT|nr:MAG: hypothetical protein COY90_01090 [Candidatus Roizmanbacteria bacterium CG_4_10_14_0_8_um_filter_39_9]
MFLLKKGDWEIKKTKKKGWGIFSKIKIGADIVIADYLGMVIKTADYDLENDKKGLYLMYYTDRASIYPDLSRPSPHLINHSCSPNCWMYPYRGHTLFFTLQSIDPGEEFTISYLLSPDDGSCNPCVHVCKCDSENCTGSMHLSKDKYEKWQRFQNTEKKKTKVAKFIFGKNLPMLSSYPKTVPHNPIYTIMCSA